MKIAEIREKFPMYKDIPDGQLVRGLHRKFYADIPYDQFLKKIDFSGPAVDPTQGMGFKEKFNAGMGKAFVNLGQGASQLVGMGPSPEEVKEQRALDAPLMKTGAGITGNIAGNVAATIPALAIPGINTYGGAAALGGVMGALQPAESATERMISTGIGGAAGVGGQAVGNTLSRLARPVQSTLSPEEKRLAAIALREGIPLDAAAATGSKPLKTMNAVFENLPFTAGPQAEQAAARSAAFNKAVLQRAGVQGSSATPDVLQTQKRALGQQFENIAGRNVLDFNQGVTNDLANLAHEATRRLTTQPPSHFSRGGNVVTNTIDDILAEVNPQGVMEGAKYQAWRSKLGRLARGTDAEAHYFGEVKKALDNAFKSQISGADAQAWSQASREYGNLKTILNAVGGPGKAAATGNIPPTQLAAALRQSVGKEGNALGRGDLNDLSRVGLQFVRDEIPNSGTAQRMFFQSLLTGGGGAGLGAGAAGATGNDPLTGAMYGAGAAGASLLAPRLAQSLMQSGPVQSYLVNQAASPTAKALAQALQAGGRTLGATAPAIYGMQQ